MGGGQNPLPTDGTGGDGTGGAGLTQQIVDVLEAIWNVLAGVFNKGGSFFAIEIISVSSPPTNLYTSPKQVKKFVIQNLSSADNLTLVGNSGTTGKIAPGSSGSGIVLNKAPASGQGGGSLSGNNIDLSGITVLGGAGSDNVSVYYEY